MLRPSAPCSISTAGLRSFADERAASNQSTVIGTPPLVNLSTRIASAVVSCPVEAIERASPRSATRARARVRDAETVESNQGRRRVAQPHKPIWAFGFAAPPARATFSRCGPLSLHGDLNGAWRCCASRRLGAHRHRLRHAGHGAALCAPEPAVHPSEPDSVRQARDGAEAGGTAWLFAPGRAPYRSDPPRF